MKPSSDGRIPRCVEIRPIRAERLLGQIAPGRGIRTGAAAAADAPVAALAALAFVAVGVAQRRKYRRVVPDVLEARQPCVASADRQVAARVDLPDVRYETHART